MTPRFRTLLAIGLFIPAAFILLTTFACLPAPVGDPATAKLDITLIGAWQGVPKAGGKETAVVTLRAWDTHTYFVQYLWSETKDGKDEDHILDYKAWLTDIAGTTFLVCEALDNRQFLDDHIDADRYWWVAKLEPKDKAMIATPIDEDSPLLKDLKTREALEAAIKANLKDAKFYKESMTFAKIDRDHLSTIDDLRKRLHVGLGS